MSDYGADSNPDLAKAFDLMVTKGFLPEHKANVMQWTYPGRRVIKIAKKIGSTNILFKFEL